MKLVRLILTCLSCLLLFAVTWAVVAAAPADWSEEALLWAEGWPRYFSLSDDGMRVVALLPYSGDDDDSRHVAVCEKVGGVWQQPVVIATNGHYSDEGFQTLPQRTHPVISGDGETIVYVGYTGETYGAYMVTRQPDGQWSAPALIDTGLPNTHYWISLSQDGRTLALSDYPFWDTRHIYVLTRSGDSWSAPLRVTPEEGSLSGGAWPSLSADGRKLVYIQNARVTFTEWVEGGWLPPQQLTQHDWQDYTAEFPQMSGDGQAIHYWLVRLVPEDGAYVRVAQDLYVMRRSGAGWSAPQKVTPTPTKPAHVTEGPAAANEAATRFVYTRPITEFDPDLEAPVIHAAQLEASEWQADGWQTSTLVDVVEYGDMNNWPRLTPDGLTLLFTGGIRETDGGLKLHGAIWQMTTSVAPPPRPLPVSTSGLIDPAGGTFFSEIDQTRYTFAPGTFTETVRFTHTHQLPATAPSGLASSGHGFVITAVYSGTNHPAQPTQLVTVTIDYGVTGHGVAIPGTLGLWRLDSAEWVQLDGVDDPGARQLTGSIDHFSHFGVFGETRRVYLPLVLR